MVVAGGGRREERMRKVIQWALSYSNMSKILTLLNRVMMGHNYRLLRISPKKLEQSTFSVFLIKKCYILRI